MTLLTVMAAARERAEDEAGITVSKDDGLLLVYALLLDELGKRTPSPPEEKATIPATDPSIETELDVTLKKIRDLRSNVYELTDAVVARMAQTMPAPPASEPDRLARILAGSAAVFSLATLATIVVTTLV